MDITLPMLLFLLLNNGNNDSDYDGNGCCDRTTLAMCLCLLCLS